jgi:hypothetical protein
MWYWLESKAELGCGDRTLVGCKGVRVGNACKDCLSQLDPCKEASFTRTFYIGVT